MHWTPDHVMHGISYAALMLIIDALPSGKADNRKAEQKPLSMEDMRRMGINYMNEG